MDSSSTRKMLDLLASLYPVRPHPKDERTVAIWTEVLKPWDYPQVRSAIIERSRENEFYPFPSEVVKYLPPPDKPDAADAYRRSAPEPRMAQQARWAERYQALLAEAMRERGLEAAPGASARDMARELEDAGVNTAGILESAWSGSGG